ncbi:unnamed protein product, partial [marine sediment metagenome]
MKLTKRATIIIGGFSLGFVAVVLLVFPVFNNRSGLDIITGNMNSDVNNVLSVGDTIPQPFIYEHFIPPENSFGMGETTFKSVNWSFFDDCFNYEKYFNGENSDYELEIEFEEVNVDVRKYKYKLKTEDEGYYGLNIVFDPKHNVYEFFESNYTFIVFYEDGNIIYNFTDIVNTLNGDINYYISNDIFHLELNKWLGEDIEFEIDPTFGYTDIGVSQNLYLDVADNYCYRAGTYSAPTTGGTADSITISFHTVDTGKKVECALYEYIDYSSGYAGELLGLTEDLTVSATGLKVFNFVEPKPEIV